MENIQMRTGIAIPEEPSLNVKTFLLAFMAIIWRRVWITTAIYCEHNKLKLSSDVVLKCLKFNIFSDAGIGNTIKPYVAKAFTDGFMMPQFYEKNIYATRVVKLYKPAYEIAKLRDREKDIEFIKKYALSIFDTDDKKVSEVAAETDDVIRNIETPSQDGEKNSNNSNNNSDEYEYSSDSNEVDSFKGILDTSERCPCKMCELVDSWDVNMGLIYSDDPFQNAVMKGLTMALKNSHI